MDILDKIGGFCLGVSNIVVAILMGAVYSAESICEWFDDLEEPTRFITFIGAFALPFFFALLTKSTIIGSYIGTVVIIRIIGITKMLYFPEPKQITVPSAEERADKMPLVVEEDKTAEVIHLPDKQEESGFTLVELLIVMVIIGTLAGLVIGTLYPLVKH